MDKVSTLIMTIRTAAGGGGPNCPTCGHPRETPFRAYRPDGRVTAGCVDACHSGHVSGADLVWHDRPEARAIRQRELESFRSGSFL